MSKANLQKTLINIAIATGIAIFFIVDRTLKALAITSAGEQTASRELIGDIFSFHFTANYNIAFSLPLSGPGLNAVLVLIIAALIYYIFYLIINKKEQKSDILLLTIILLGAISNILDRFTYGFVIDYLELRYFTVFNLADTMISGGAMILIIKNIKKK